MRRPGALEGDGLPCSGIAGDIKRAVSTAIGECIGIADAPADIAGAVRIRPKRDGDVCMGKTLEQTEGGIIIVYAFAHTGRGNFDTSVRIVRARCHLVP